MVGPRTGQGLVVPQGLSAVLGVCAWAVPFCPVQLGWQEAAREGVVFPTACKSVEPAEALSFAPGSPRKSDGLTLMPTSKTSINKDLVSTWACS